jgi:hypothetical protein
MIGGEYSLVLSETRVKARKEHKCGECYRKIEPKETYVRTATIYEGELNAYKTCLQCMEVKHWLARNCDGYVYTHCYEDLRDHVEKAMGMEFYRAVVGMKNKWKNVTPEKAKKWLSRDYQTNHYAT